jgi:outer membrane protein assembly factor BamB
MGNFPIRMRQLVVILLAASLVSCSEVVGGGNTDTATRIAWTVSSLRSPTRSGRLAVDSQHVYAYRDGLSIAAIRLSDHSIAWTAETDESFDNGASLRGVTSCEGSVIFGSYLAVYAVAPETGRRRWKWEPSRGGSIGFSAPVCDASTVYIGTGSPLLIYAIDAATGREKWVADLGRTSGGNGFVNSPSVSDGVVVACTREFGNPRRGMIAGLDAASGLPKWQYSWTPLSSRPDASCAVNVAIGKGIAVGAADDGRIFGLELQTGTLRWTAPEVSRFGTPSDERPVAIVGDVVLAGSLSGVVTGLDLSTGSELWRSGDAINAPVTVINKHVAGDNGQFIATTLSGSAYAFDSRTGREQWLVKYGSTLNSRVLFGPGVLTQTMFFVVGSDGLYAIRR